MTAARKQASALARAAAAAPASALWAIEYADAGLHPIRLRPAKRGDKSTGKSPIGEGWQTRPLDLEALCSELYAKPRSNLGLRMGLQPNGSAIVALDVDDADAAEALFERLGRPPRTMQTETGRGRHLFYSVPPEALPRLRNFVKRDGIDLRTEGGQVAAAPSVHYSGAVYRTVLRPIAALPDAWLDWLLKGTARKARDGAAAPRESAAVHGRSLDLGPLADAPALAAEGSRHRTAWCIGAWAGSQGFSDEAIDEEIRESFPTNDPDMRAKDALDGARLGREGGTTGWSELAQLLGEDVRAALEHANRDPVVAAWHERRREARAANDVTHGEVDATGLHLHPGSGWPWLLQSNTTYWMHARDDRRYGRQFPQAELESRAAHDLAGLVGEDECKPAALRSAWTRAVDRVVYSYTDVATTYDSARNHVRVAALDRMPSERAGFHAPVDRWLRALFGAEYERGAQWLASCASLDRPAPCLYLIGPRELGKSLLFDGLARLWGCSSPVPMGEIVADFNEKQCECPLVVADEGLPSGLEFSRFRRVVTEHDRSVNRKNLAKVDVEGCARVAIGANNSGVLRWARHGELAQSDQDAIADRLLVIECGAEAREALQAHPASVVAKWATHEIAEHVLWLAQTVALEDTGRMCVSPHGGEPLVRAVLNDRYAPIALAIVEALNGGGLTQREAHVWRSKKDDRLIFVHAEQLHAWMQGRDRHLRVGDVRDACKALARPGGDVTQQQRVPGSKRADPRPRAYSLDADRVSEAAGMRL